MRKLTRQDKALNELYEQIAASPKLYRAIVKAGGWSEYLRQEHEKKYRCKAWLYVSGERYRCILEKGHKSPGHIAGQFTCDS